MSTWTPEELERIAGPQQIDIAPVRRNGEMRRPTPIWVVRAGDDLYVRAAYGASKWHGVARTSHHAQVHAGGLEWDVAIEDAESAVPDEVDSAYRRKYGVATPRSSIRSTTLRTALRRCA